MILQAPLSLSFSPFWRSSPKAFVFHSFLLTCDLNLLVSCHMTKRSSLLSVQRHKWMHLVILMGNIYCIYFFSVSTKWPMGRWFRTAVVQGVQQLGCYYKLIKQTGDGGCRLLGRLTCAVAEMLHWFLTDSSLVTVHKRHTVSMVTF